MYKPIAHAHHVSPGQPWIRSLELFRQEPHRLADDLKVSDHGVNGLLVNGEPVESIPWTCLNMRRIAS